MRWRRAVTLRELGERLGVDATGLYRVVKRLTNDGRVRKQGTGLHPTEPAAAEGTSGPGAAGETASPPASGSAESQPRSPSTGTPPLAER